MYSMRDMLLRYNPWEYGTQPHSARRRLIVEEARNYGYSQIDIEITREEFIIIAYAIQSLEVARPLGNRPSQKHRASSYEISILKTIEQFITFAPQLFAKYPRPPQFRTQVRAQGPEEGRGGDARV